MDYSGSDQAGDEKRKENLSHLRGSYLLTFYGVAELRDCFRVVLLLHVSTLLHETCLKSLIRVRVYLSLICFILCFWHWIVFD